MQSLFKEVELYIYRLIHDSLMKEIVREYHSLYYLKKDNNYLSIKTINMSVCCNYRELEFMWSPTNHVICKLDDKYSGRILPEKYIFSSGLNSRLGYKNE